MIPNMHYRTTEMKSVKYVDISVVTAVVTRLFRLT